jgi:hypothetical protein
MRLYPEARLPSTVAKKHSPDGFSPDWLRYAVPLPPTPPRPSQKRLEEEEQSSGGHSAPAIMTDGAGGEGTIGEDADNTSASEAEGSDEQDGDGETSDGMQEDSPRVYTKEEMERKIFGEEGEEEDPAFWDVDRTVPPAVVQSGEHMVADASATDEESDGGSEGEVEAESKSDGLFGSPSNVTSTSDVHPHSQQKDETDENASVADGTLGAATEPAADLAVVDALDGGNSSENVTLPTVITSPLTAPSPTPLNSSTFSLSAQPPSPLSKSGSRTRLTNDEAPTGDSSTEDLLKVDTIVIGNPSVVITVPCAQSPPPEEVEPCKPVVVAKSEEEPTCSMTRRVVRKKRSLDFNPTRPGLFSGPTSDSPSDIPLGKRKRSRDDDGDETEMASGGSSDPLRDREGPLPR